MYFVRLNLFLVTENPLKRQERNSSAIEVLISPKTANSAAYKVTAPRMFTTMFRARIIPLIAYEKAKPSYLMGGIEIDAIIQHGGNFTYCTQVPFLVLILAIVDTILKSIEPIIPLAHSIFFSYAPTIESLNDIVNITIIKSKS